MIDGREQSSYRILLVDDNPSILEDYRTILCPEESDNSLEQLAESFFGDGEAHKPDNDSNPLDLKETSFELSVADQGEKAIDLVRQSVAEGRPFALAIVDMRMPPGLGGLETIRRIWDIDSDIQTVICSAYSDHSHQDIIARLGDSDRLLILRKPFDHIEVSQIASALSAKWDTSRQIREHIDGLEEKIQLRTRELQQVNASLQTAIIRQNEAEAHLRHAAFHDALTNLPNRALLLEKLARFSTHGPARMTGSYGLVFMDLDCFKSINDSLGHQAGDGLLVGVADRLREASHRIKHDIKASDVVVARLGGDEFVVAFEGVAEAQQASEIAQIVMSSLDEPIAIGEHRVTAQASIGIALASGSDDRPDTLLRDADTALYLAKAEGKNGIKMFDATLKKETRERNEIEGDLRNVMETDQLRVVYHPIICLETGKVVSAEALLRWDHPAKGSIPPARFIPMAEEIGMITPIGKWVLRQACEALVDWTRRGVADPDQSVCVNVSPKQVLRGDLCEYVEQTLRDVGLDASRLRLEVTESLILRDTKVACETIDKLHELGVQILLDDFGTGYSSLKYLHQITADGIKMDRSFVRRMSEDFSYSNTIQAIITLAANRGMTVVAEGIETIEQLVQLQALDCPLGQGFFFSKPVSPDHFDKKNYSCHLFKQSA